jgi:hypothetical protein
VKRESDAYFVGNSRTFLAGLMGWESDDPPTASALSGGVLVAQGWAHIVTIQKNGGQILGHRELALDGICGLREVSHRGGGTVMLYEGDTAVRPATAEEAALMPVMATWGYNVVSVLAERLFVKRLPITKH